MRRRRGKGEGSIYQRADKQWCGSVTIGYDERGKRQRRAVYGGTKTEVRRKLAKLQSDALSGSLTDPERVTVAQFLRRWVEDTARPAVRPATHRLYAGVIRNHINPRLGGVSLARLTPAQVQGLYTIMERDGCSARMRQLTHAVLRRALGQALKWNMILRNACDCVEKPKAPKKTMQVLDPTQVAQFLSAAESDRLFALYVLALAAGLRQGELLGLQQEDIGLKTGKVFVRRQLSEDNGVLRLTEPKTEKARRCVDLPEFAIAALRDHRKRMLVEGNFGSFVFCDSTGKPLRKSNVTRRSFKPLLQKAGLPAIRFHDLRHTAATLLLSQGVHPKIVQERLGHSQIAVTLDTYSHVLPSMQKEAAAKLDTLFADLRSENAVEETEKAG